MSVLHAHSLLKQNMSVKLEKGMPAQIETEDDLLFNGFCQEVSYKDYPAQNVRLYAIECSDLHYLVDKRIYVRGFVNQSCGAIVKDNG